MFNDVCKYLIDWPENSSDGNIIRLDVNMLARADLYITIASNYSDDAVV